MSFNQGAPTVPTLINSSAVLVTGNAVSANALTVRQFGTGNVFSAQTITGATALFVSSTSNVGIGTTNPSSRLHVQGGDIYASSNINGNAGNTTWRLQPQYVNSNPFPSNFRIANGWDPIAGTGQANYGAVGINLNSYQGGSQIEFYTSATNNAVPTERMRIATNGNVGIGTANPGAPLTIISSVGQGANSTLSMADGTKSLGVVMNASGSAYNVVTNAGDTLILQSSGAPNTGAISIGPHSSGALGMRIACASNALSLYANTITTYSNASSPAALMTMTNGRVGIGSASPAALLTCAAAYTNGGTHAEETGAKIILGANNQAGPYGVAIQCRVPANSTVNESDMQFSTCDNSGNQLVRVTIKGTSNPVGGSVGIGTASPGYQLDLSGDGARKLTTTTWLTGSDERIKTDIQSANLQTCYDTIKSIDLKYFKWNFPAESNVTVDDNHSLGFIAQDVKKVFPNAVSETNSYGFTDFLSLNTDQILKAMYGALRQTMADKESLEQRLAALEAKLAA
jgi:hypothetical protein